MSHLSDLTLVVPSPRAKEIKSKLGVLLQKPENAIDLIIPYPEKIEKKPEKLQKWVAVCALSDSEQDEASNDSSDAAMKLLLLHSCQMIHRNDECFASC